MNQPTLTRSLIAAGALLVGTSAHAIQIDTFDDGALPEHVVSSPSISTLTSSSTLVTPAAIGGSRTLTVSGGTGTLGTVLSTGDGLLDFSNSPISSGQGELSYSSLGGIDFTDGGAADSFAFTVNFADADVDYIISVTGTGAPVGSAISTLPSGIAGTGDEQEVIIPFSDLGAGDFTQIDSLTITFVPKAGVLGADLSISNLRTVPEPSSLALIALGGLAMMRRRRA